MMVEIKSYQDVFREQIRNICMETAKKNYKKNDNVCLMFLDYYLDNEPENVFLAVEENKVAGYIVCSTDASLYQEKMKSIYIPKLMKRSLILGIFSKICLKVSKKLDIKYSGGFHINITKDYQGLKLGPKLLNHLGNHLKNKGNRYMYLVTENKKTRGYGFYKHFGFDEAKHYIGGSIALIYNLEKLK